MTHRTGPVVTLVGVSVTDGPVPVVTLYTIEAGVVKTPACLSELLSQSETSDKASVSFDICLSEILEKTSSLTYHLEQASS